MLVGISAANNQSQFRERVISYTKLLNHRVKSACVATLLQESWQSVSITAASVGK
jgi:hypothetical protein